MDPALSLESPSAKLTIFLFGSRSASVVIVYEPSGFKLDLTPPNPSSPAQDPPIAVKAIKLYGSWNIISLGGTR